MFAQPFLIRTTIILVGSPLNQLTQSSGYALIGAFALVYGGIAVSTVVARHKMFRIITMMRDSLVGMIYDKIFDLSIAGLDRKGPPTLMSADIERLASGIRYMHDVWAYVFEIVLALYLLYRELGVAGVAPIIIAFACALFSLVISALSRRYQKDWLESIEARVEATSSMLNSMKMIKLRGLTQKLYDTIYGLKETEIYMSLRFRRVLIAAAAVAFSNGPVAPVISFAIFSWGYHGVLTTEIAFYSLTLFALLNDAIGGLVESATGLASSYGSLERIEAFLRSDTLQHGRQIESDKAAVVACQRSTGWDEDAMQLRNLDFKIQPEAFTFIVGPTGSGKSTLLSSILGEAPFHTGYLGVSTETMAYCAQDPWVINDTLKRNVLGECLYEVHRYNAVIQACGLEADCQALENGDATMLGSGGSALSGGQKQRVALARAVYSQLPTVVLDNPFSGLDPSTEEMVMSHLFGPEGLFRKMQTTVIIATNSTQRLSYADHIIVLGANGSIAQQGSFKELQASNADFIESCSTPSKQDQTSTSKENTEDTPMSELPELSEPPMEGNHRTGDMSLYLYYAKTVGVWNFIAFTLLMVVYVFFLTFPTIWVQWWSNENDIAPNQQLNRYLGVYFFLAAGAFFSVVAAAWHLIENVVTAAARKFHKYLLGTALNAPMSLFSTNDTGVITNKFTQDLQLIDMELPLTMLNTCLGKCHFLFSTATC
jgi:ABC-type multidrug transport system fused ATPase/permease subunit